MMTPFPGAEQIIDDLNFVQRAFNAFQKLLREGEEYAPQSAVGSDPSGQVSVTLDAKGLPVSLRVKAGWNQKLKPEGLGTAVVGAAGAALLERSQVWNEQLGRSGWRERMDRLEQRLQNNLPSDEGGLPPAFRRLPPGQEPRPLSDLTEGMLKLFDNIDTISAPRPAAPDSVGQNRTKRIALTVAGGVGITACEIDSAWAAGRSGNDLTAALTEALEAALAGAAERPEAPSPTAEVDGLIAEAVALLDNLPLRFR